MSEPTPNGLEQELTRRISWGMSSDELARQLALVREGATLEGPRRLVSGIAQLPIRHAHEGIDSAERHAWRSWFDELHRQRLRPCGWPAVQRTYVATPLYSAAPVNGTGPSWAEVDADDERAEYLVVSVTCEAVPASP